MIAWRSIPGSLNCSRIFVTSTNGGMPNGFPLLMVVLRQVAAGPTGRPASTGRSHDTPGSEAAAQREQHQGGEKQRLAHHQRYRPETDRDELFQVSLHAERADRDDEAPARDLGAQRLRRLGNPAQAVET